MRSLWAPIAGAALLLGVVAPAGAGVVPWSGTATVKLGAGRPNQAQVTGAGVATVNGSSFSSHLNTLKLAGGVSAADVQPVTDPEITALIPAIGLSVTAGSGTFGDISGGAPISPRTLPLQGLAKICIALPGCTNYLALPLTINNGNTGVGIGGLITVGGNGPFRFSLVNEPWTIGTGMRIQQTDNAAFEFRSVAGFVHGPASQTSSTALTSGVIQLIAPIQVSTIGLPGEIEKLSLFGTLRIQFAPEPGLLLLVGSGGVGLALLGRARMRRR
jgi:hypothetical protein